MTAHCRPSLLLTPFTKGEIPSPPLLHPQQGEVGEGGRGAGAADPLPPTAAPAAGGGRRREGEGGGGRGLVLQIPSPPLLHLQHWEVGERGGRGRGAGATDPLPPPCCTRSRGR
ncbi:unnamed protein product [Closterium sp. Naga37s-1]|nr:unnamed protein product [Closterium sp. Naga37s-1]